MEADAIVLALMPPLPLADRLLLASLGAILAGWLAMHRGAGRKSLALVCGLGMAGSLAYGLWLVEPWIHPAYWQRDGFVSFVVGCLMGALCALFLVRRHG